jgi:hypothetical protein
MMLGQGTWEKAYQGEEPGKRIQTSPGTTGVNKTNIYASSYENTIMIYRYMVII